MPYKPKVYRPAVNKREKKQQQQAQYRASKDTRMYRQKWWEETRLRIAARDNWQCVECGKDVGLSKGDFHCDHKVERPQGAAYSPETWDSDENLQTLCVTHHNAKSARHGARR